MNTKFDAGLTDPTKISVHQTAEPAQPVAWYVERRAPGYGDDGVKSGPWWSKNEAKRFADDHHVLRPLYQPTRSRRRRAADDGRGLCEDPFPCSLMEEIEMDGYAVRRFFAPSKAEVRRRCGVVE